MKNHHFQWFRMILVEDSLKTAQIAWGNLYNWKKYSTFAKY